MPRAANREQNGSQARIRARYPRAVNAGRVMPTSAGTDARQSPPILKPTNPMKTKARFYHAGCPVCVSAEQNVAVALDRSRYDVEIVHLGQSRDRLAEAEAAGVKSVPALVVGRDVYHINHGADLSALR
jgi:glutaredoxin